MTTTTTTKEHAENIIGISVKAMTVTWIIQFFDISPLIISDLFLWIRKN
jgi:hypothetical protein